MTALRARDLEAALAFLGDASEIDGPEPFTTELLDRLLELVPCELATYLQLDFASGVVSSYVPCSAEGQTADSDVPWTLSAEDAVGMSGSLTRTWRRQTGKSTGVATWSDLVARRRRLRYEVAEDVQREWGIIDHACLQLLPSDVRMIWLTFESTGRDFTERDRLLIELLEPHFVARVHAARVRRRLAALEAALESGDDAPALVVTARDGEIEFASTAARRLLETYFGKTNGRLPEPFTNRTNGDQPRFTAVRNGTRLLVEPAGNDGALLLHEEPNVSLTRRERDVLRCIAAGKTTAETARLLWVTEATVSKHLEHVYRKLGVTSRTAALAKLGAVLN